MASAVETLNIDWKCRHTWQVASYNTMWCLIGCSIGDIGTIAFFDFYNIAWPVMAIMALAIFNGLLTSIILETFILCKQMAFNLALRTALGMSLISMIAMELAMNLTDIAITGGAKITLIALPIMLLAGFLTPCHTTIGGSRLWEKLVIKNHQLISMSKKTSQNHSDNPVNYFF